MFQLVLLASVVFSQSTMELTGEEVCEGHGFDETTCESISCCVYDGECFSGLARDKVCPDVGRMDLSVAPTVAPTCGIDSDASYLLQAESVRCTGSVFVYYITLEACAVQASANGMTYFSYRSESGACHIPQNDAQAQCVNNRQTGAYHVYSVDCKAACDTSTCLAGDYYATCPAGKVCGTGGCYSCPSGSHVCPRGQGFYNNVCPNDKQCHSSGCVPGENQEAYLADKKTCCNVKVESAVSCGRHMAASCAACPEGNGAAWCNGECTWSNNACVDKLVSEVSLAAQNERLKAVNKALHKALQALID